MNERTTIPTQGRDHEQLLLEMTGFGTQDADYRGGHTWSMVYYAGDDHSEFLKSAHNLYFSENGLNPMAFRSLKRMESEVVQMTAGMLNGPPTTVGAMTSGGTESILMAVKTWRDRARAKWPWIRRPNVVCPVTIHPAFDKAAHYFGVKLRKVPVGEDGIVRVRDLKRLINRNTILIAASAPQYATGAVDPIPELGALALGRGIPLHVDGCFGGFIQPWLERIGVDMPVFDFRVPGVMSMSADAHKYGYAAKGASLILYRDMDAMKHQFFVSVDWPGGIYASPTIAGSRPGGCISAAWASLMAMGEDGYIALASEAWSATERLRAGIRAIEGLKILGTPHSTIVTYASDDPSIDIYAIADLLQENGWATDRQQLPPAIHCTVNASNSPVLDAYLEDLGDAVSLVRANPSLAREGEAAMYGLMAKVPIRGLVQHTVRQVMADMYAPDGGIPDLAEVGTEDGDGALLGLLRTHEDRLHAALDRIASARRALSRRST